MNKYNIFAVVTLTLCGFALAQNGPLLPTAASADGNDLLSARLFDFPNLPWDTNALADSLDYSNPPDGAVFVARQAGPDSSVILLGYNYYDGSNWLGRMSRSTNSGKTFTPFTHGNGFFVDVCLHGNGIDSAYVLSILQVSSGYHLFLKRSLDDGATWSDTVRVDLGTSTFTDKPMFVTAGSCFYCTYTDFSGGTHFIRMCRSTDWGQTWNTGDVNVSTTDGTGSCPAVAPNGDVYVAWGQPAGWVPTSVWFNRSTDYGASWATPSLVRDLTVSGHLAGWRANHPFPAVVVDTLGKIYLTVQNSLQGGGWDVMVVTSTDSGQT